MLISYMHACAFYLTEHSAASEVTAESEAVSVPEDITEATDAAPEVADEVVPAATGIQPYS